MANKQIPDLHKKPSTRTIIDDVLGEDHTAKLWSISYPPVLPLIPQKLSSGGVLPSMLYMARWGQRHGKSRFVETFTAEGGVGVSPTYSFESQDNATVTIADVAVKLLGQADAAMDGFNDDNGSQLLGDLLLTWCLENTDHAAGQDQQIQQALPTHYLASWIDLPCETTSQYGISELLTALLVNQDDGDWLTTGGNSPFALGTDFTQNRLLAAFGRGMKIGNKPENFGMDVLQNQLLEDLGIDEMLSIYMANILGHPVSGYVGATPIPPIDLSEIPIHHPKEVETNQNRDVGTPHAPIYGANRKIPNHRPLARAAATRLRNDLATFMQSYGNKIPRQRFLHMLETGINLGISNLLLTTAKLLHIWEQEGRTTKSQSPWPLFVDCSCGHVKQLQIHSETIASKVLQSYQRLPILLMLLRVLDHMVRTHLGVCGAPTSPHAPPTESATTAPAASLYLNGMDIDTWLDQLGAIYHDLHPYSTTIQGHLHENCMCVAAALEKAGCMPDVVYNLRHGAAKPGLRFAQALYELIDVGTPHAPIMDGAEQSKLYLTALDVVLLHSRIDDLTSTDSMISKMGAWGVPTSPDAQKHHVIRRSVTLNASLLDFLIHCHSRGTGSDYTTRSLSLRDLLHHLREYYGLYVDQAPPDYTIPQELLSTNKMWLVRHLRDLGLLCTVDGDEELMRTNSRYLVGGASHA